jgi:LPS export ABC transporter protein LptC
MKNVYERVRKVPANRLVLWGFLCVSTLFIFFIVFSDEKEFHRNFSISKAGSYMEGLRIVSKKDGADALIITARRADFSKDETVATMDAVTMEMKKEGALLNADHGTYNMNTKELTLENNVTVKAKDAVIHVNNLSWNPGPGLLSAEGKVLVDGNKFTLEGEGLTATVDNKVRLTKNVRATFN